MSSIVYILQQAALQFFILIGAPALLGLILSELARRTNRVYQRSLWPRLGLFVFGSIGIPIHELSHFLFCRLFGLRVQNVKWFDPRGRGGAHGSVVHHYDPWSLRHRVGHIFVGLGPVLLGPLLIGLIWSADGRVRLSQQPLTTRGIAAPLATTASSLQPPPISILKPLVDDIVLLAREMTGFLRSLAAGPWPLILLMVYLSLSIASQLELSREDLKVAASGLGPSLALLCAINGVVSAFQVDGASWLFATLAPTFMVWLKVVVMTATFSTLHWLVAWASLNFVHWIAGRSRIPLI